MKTCSRYSDTRRRHFIDLLNDTDQYWVEIMGDRLFHDLNYYDLFTRMWLRLNNGLDSHNSPSGPGNASGANVSAEALRKSELYQLMPNVSQRTAVKYIQIAIDHGLLIEWVDPGDLRSRRVAMSADLKRKIELFLDYSISVFDSLRPRRELANPPSKGTKPRDGEVAHNA
jgi:hypothetical protein